MPAHLSPVVSEMISTSAATLPAALSHSAGFSGLSSSERGDTQLADCHLSVETIMRVVEGTAFEPVEDVTEGSDHDDSTGEDTPTLEESSNSRLKQYVREKLKAIDQESLWEEDQSIPVYLFIYCFIWFCI